MQPLVPILFTKEIERVPHIEGAPAFTGIQTRRPVYVTERAVVALHAQQAGIGRRLFVEYTGSDAITIPYWNGESLDGKRVAYMHDGLLGDECIHTSVYAQLRQNYPRMDLHAFPERTSSENHRLLGYNRDIGGNPRNRNFWFTAEQIEGFDYWITPINVGHVFRGISEKTQYELLEDELCISIETKCPYLYIAGIERQTIRSLVHSGAVRTVGEEAGGRIMSLIEAGKLIVLQLNASEQCRTPRPMLWVDVAMQLRAAIPDMVFAVCGDDRDVSRFHEMGGNRIEGVIYEMNNPATRQIHLSPYGLLYFLERAQLVICPDSFFMHGAAAFDTPTLAIWQDDPEAIEEGRVPSPQSRIKHYDYCEATGISTEASAIVDHAISLLR